MTLLDVVVALAVGCLVGLGGAQLLALRRRDQTRPVQEAPAAPAAEPARQASDPLGDLLRQTQQLPAGPWHAIPGDRLELLDTGFAIELHPLYRAPYWLFSPEGFRLTAWHDLDDVKRLGEQHAAQRASFSVAPFDARQLVQLRQIGQPGQLGQQGEEA